MLIFQLDAITVYGEMNKSSFLNNKCANLRATCSLYSVMTHSTLPFFWTVCVADLICRQQMHQTTMLTSFLHPFTPLIVLTAHTMISSNFLFASFI